RLVPPRPVPAPPPAARAPPGARAAPAVPAPPPFVPEAPVVPAPPLTPAPPVVLPLPPPLSQAFTARRHSGAIASKTLRTVMTGTPSIDEVRGFEGPAPVFPVRIHLTTPFALIPPRFRRTECVSEYRSEKTRGPAPIASSSVLAAPGRATSAAAPTMATPDTTVSGK